MSAPASRADATLGQSPLAAVSNAEVVRER